MIFFLFIWWNGRVWFMAMLLKSIGGDEPSVGSNPTSIAVSSKSLFVAILFKLILQKEKGYLWML